MDFADKANIYGAHRSIEPAGVLPQLAWSLDTSLPIRGNEMLVHVHTLNLNAASFSQMVQEMNGDQVQIIRKICNIVTTRGKMQNPITGSGGTFYGTVAEIGPDHPDKGQIAVGEKICSLVSLTLCPLVIKTVTNIDMHTGQLDIEGYAILFASGLYCRVPTLMSPKLFLSVFGEAGSGFQAYQLCHPGQITFVLGAGEKIGVMSLFALREKLGSSGRLIAVIEEETQRQTIESLAVADVILCIDTGNILAASEKIALQLQGQPVDLTIDCFSKPGTEMLSVLVTREGGVIYYANPATRYSIAGLGAEGIGKEVTLLFYQGYLKGHVEFCEHLINKYPALRQNLTKRYHNKNYIKNNVQKLSLHHPPEVFQKHASRGEQSDIVVHSQAMNDILRMIHRISPYDTTVLITGESGTGKEVVAKTIFRSSGRSAQPYLKVNCAAIPDNLIEAELFGYEAGAFTGALKEGKPGYFELANHGTLFLDEIAEMSLSNQTKLLRVIQEKEIIRVGGKKIISIDVRIIAATNRDIKNMVHNGLFREDLYYRINVVNLHIPPLRQRREAIPPLVETFLQKFNVQYHMEKRIDTAGMQLLVGYEWPGNIRELENFIQRVILYSETQAVTARDIDQLLYGRVFQEQWREPLLPKEQNSLSAEGGMTEKECYQQAVARYKSTREIAAALNTSQSTVVRRLKKYGLQIKPGSEADNE